MSAFLVGWFEKRKRKGVELGGWRGEKILGNVVMDSSLENTSQAQFTADGKSLFQLAGSTLKC